MRLATFNVENLYARYNFRRGFDPVDSHQFSTNNLAFTIQDATAKQVTAQAIREVDADVIALQEVDNLKVLDRFASKYLGSMKYKHKILIDAYDPRYIDVALASRYPIKHIRTYRADRNAKNTAFLFSRDCLEVDIEVGNKMLTVYVNHFKSMTGGRDNTYDRRKEQADRVADIVTNRWGHARYDGNYAVVGDFNDYPEGKSSIQSLLTHPGLVDISQRQQEKDRWTHFWAGGNEYNQIDFLLLSPALAENKSVIPEMMRKGLPYRAKQYDGARFDLVGERSPKASDHCPVYVDVDLT
ncbi:MAG: endonuclease/exonuclease/phosphatase family protein [Pseudomonadota bacterium]